jgi:PII-like signaling protein
MKNESDAILLRIFIGESAMYEGKHLYKYLVEFFRKEGLAGATVLRGIDGFGKSSHAHTTSILRLSTDLPIVVEVADTQTKIDAVKPKLEAIVTEGLITEEKVKIILYKGNDKTPS